MECCLVKHGNNFTSTCTLLYLNLPQHSPAETEEKYDKIRISTNPAEI